MHRLRTLVLARSWAPPSSPWPARPWPRRRPRRRRDVHAHQLGVRQCGGGLRARPRRLAHARGTVATGGNGTGAGLGSQGALVLDDDRLFAVNAGSNSLSLLHVGRRGKVRLADVDPSGGARPISVTVHGKFVYVLNAGDASTPANIRGFLALWGQLVPLPGSTRPLSAAAPDPAQVEFSPNGRQLVVTEKATNMIVTYEVRRGYASGPNAQPSAGQTPFGFGFDRRGLLIVSEAFGGAPDASARLVLRPVG